MKNLSQYVATTSSSLVVVLFLAILSLPAVSTAQTDTTEMTVEQLEAFINEQQEALQAAISERDRSMAEKKEVEEQLAEQQARQEQIEEELKTLCLEKAKLDPAADQTDCG